MVFSIHSADDFSFTRNIPAMLHRYVLPVSSGISAASQDGVDILLQESQCSCSKLIHTVYRTNRDTELRIRDEGPFFYVCLALQHDRRLDIAGLGPVFLKEGQYNFFYAPTFDVRSLHESGRDYITLSFAFKREVLLEWPSFFPLLAHFLKGLDAGKPVILLEGNRWINRDIQDMAYRFTHTSTETPGFEDYVNLTTRTLLFQLLVQSIQQQAPSPYTHYEIDGIHAARDIIRGNIRRHLLIREIAQKVGVNELKLKTGFRELFGNGVYEFLRLERMDEARTLLTMHARSIKQVAAQTGYKSVNSFIKAFKKQFGLTPGEFRKTT